MPGELKATPKKEKATSALPKVGWFCTYVPEEILQAAGLQPVRLWGSTRPIALADGCLHANLCPYMRSCSDAALREEYADLSGVVFVNSCDAMRRLYDAWRHYTSTPFVYLLDLPRNSTKAAVSFFKHELARFQRAVEEFYGVALTPARLQEAIVQANEKRRLLAQLDARRRQHPVWLRGAEWFSLLRESMNDWPAARRRLRELLATPPSTSTSRPRLLIVGAVLESPEVLTLAEEAGADVVAEDLCFGRRYFESLVEPDAEALEALARRYLTKRPCARMANTARRAEELLRLVETCRADGVIYYQIKFCDTHQWDYPLIRRALAAQRIPVLFLESDYTPGAAGQMRTRVQALVEMLREQVCLPLASKCGTMGDVIHAGQLEQTKGTNRT
ncbi:MAG TPA: 2-hydroxyacyl-CoA dehydratase [Armatimonadetes bacterium]|nr:2-hydroxyacyl-CoA dehydratase [Armatimonadota bacterium]